MADFVPVPPSGEFNETYVSSLIVAYSLHYIKHNVILQTGSTYRLAVIG